MADRRGLGPLGGLASNPRLDRWISFLSDGTVTVRTGKAELGQGLRTAMTAIAADELGVDPARVHVRCADTDESPDEGNTAGSRSMEESGAGMRQACAHARRLLVRQAAERLGCEPAELSVCDGVVSGAGGESVDYWELMGGRSFDVEITEPTQTLPIASRRYIGHGLARVDLPAKTRGEPVFVHDLVRPGLRHARVVRPPRMGARLVSVGAVGADVGADVVRQGSFVAVVADRAHDAIVAADELARGSVWAGGQEVPDRSDDADYLERHVSESTAIVDGRPGADPPGPRLRHDGAGIVVEARYSKPFVMHGAIGPSAAVAHLCDGHLTVWSHTQNAEGFRRSAARALGMDEADITVRHVDGAGCYGHNGADDAAFDAALVAVSRPEEPVSLVWSRADEHRWEPLGPAMSVRLDAGLDDRGRICSWQHEGFSYAHASRPHGVVEPDKSGLLAAWSFDPPAGRPTPAHARGFHSGAHRNADPIYTIGTRRVVSHLVAGMVPRTSSLRALGAYANVFAIESFMDELAAVAGTDPISFRLRHLDDPRARAVIEAVADMAGGLEAPGGLDAPGRGLAFARFKNYKAYVAVIAEAMVLAHTGEIRLTRAWIAADAGEVVDPDGLVNQLEGGFVQAASWTVNERTDLDRDGVTSHDWDSYPILKFSDVPEIATRLLDHPGEAPLGAGEASTGPTGAAIANAVFQNTGARLRDLPLRPPRVKAALDDLLDQSG